MWISNIHVYLLLLKGLTISDFDKYTADLVVLDQVVSIPIYKWYRNIFFYDFMKC